jgi:hypothetical protein
MKLATFILLLCICMAQKESLTGNRNLQAVNNRVFLCECNRNETNLKCKERKLNKKKAKEIASNSSRLAAIGTCAETKFAACRCTKNNSTNVTRCTTLRISVPKLPAQVKKPTVTLGVCKNSTNATRF